jgi:hypothetical protein
MGERLSETSFDDIFTAFYLSPLAARAVAALETEASQESRLDKADKTLRVYFFSEGTRGSTHFARRSDADVTLADRFVKLLAEAPDLDDDESRLVSVPCACS